MTSPVTVDERRPDRVSVDGWRNLAVRHPVNVPWVVVGVLMVVGSALVFAVWARSASSTTGVLVARHRIQAGQVVDRNDLRVAQVRVPSDVNSLSRREAPLVAGQVARTDITAGTVITADLVTRQGVVRRSRALVGVPVDPTTLPIRDLRPGDPVVVVAIPDPATPEARPLTIWGATVFTTIEALDQLGEARVSLSLEVDVGDAPLIAAASRGAGVHMVLVADLEDIPPDLLFSDLLAERPADLAGATP